MQWLLPQSLTSSSFLQRSKSMSFLRLKANFFLCKNKPTKKASCRILRHRVNVKADSCVSSAQGSHSDKKWVTAHRAFLLGQCHSWSAVFLNRHFMFLTSPNSESLCCTFDSILTTLVIVVWETSCLTFQACFCNLNGNFPDPTNHAFYMLVKPTLGEWHWQRFVCESWSQGFQDMLLEASECLGDFYPKGFS